MSRLAMVLGLASTLALAACGSTAGPSTEQTVIVNPRTGQTMKLPSEDQPNRCAPGGVC